MRQGNNNHRRGGGRNRHNNNGGGGGGAGNPSGGMTRRPNSMPLRHQVFDSHGPSGMRVKGNAFQVYEKYVALARDCHDRVEAENYWQHAEHYSRIIAVINEMEAQVRPRFAAGEGDQPNGGPHGGPQGNGPNGGGPNGGQHAPHPGNMPNGNVAQPNPAVFDLTDIPGEEPGDATVMAATA